MTAFRVWAPAAGHVALALGPELRDTRPMAKSDGGWWTLEVAEAGAGTDYGFCLDGRPARPDPRSAWQPHGVDGPSRVVDHGEFAWTDGAWRGVHLPSAVVYELHVGTFTPEGTFEAAIDHLDHLVDLGVDLVELMPVAQFGGDRGWGYDGVDLFAPHEAYGGPVGLKRFVDGCHRKHLGVMLDVVYNHLGPAGNYLQEFGPYFTDRHTTNWGDAVNFDGAGSDEVRAFVVDNALMWLGDYHLDGLRLDAVHAIVDTSAVHILEALSTRVRRLAAHAGRPLWLVAESDLNDPRFVRSPELGGYGCDAAWADEFHHAVHAVLTGETSGYYEDFGPLHKLATALRRAWVYAGEYSPHRGRAHGRPPDGLGGERFVVFVQNHDQVGNRATGERITDLTSPARAKVGAALTLLSRFVPMLFQGEEWAASAPFLYFTDHRDAALGRAVSEGRRNEFASFGWSPEDVPDPQDPATFQRSLLDWSEVGRAEHAVMLEWYRTLLQLRRTLPDLRDPLAPVETEWDDDEGWLVATRGRVAVAANLGAGTVKLDETGELRAVSSGSVAIDGGGLVLPPDSVAVIERA